MASREPAQTNPVADRIVAQLLDTQEEQVEQGPDLGGFLDILGAPLNLLTGLSASQGEEDIDRARLEALQRAPGAIAEGAREFLSGASQALASPLNIMSGLSASRGTTEQDRARSAALFAGLVGSLAKTGEGAAGALQDFGLLFVPQEEEDLALEGIEALQFTELTKNFFQRAREGLYSEAELIAKNAGLEDDELASAYETGNFIGAIAPIGASIKMAGLALRSGFSLQKGGLAAGFMTDTLAGVIYGTALTPADDIEERLNNAKREAALFGVGNIVIRGPISGFKFYRNNRFLDSERMASFRTKLADMQNRGSDAAVMETSDDAISLATLWNEEGYMSQSPAALAILERGNPRAAVVQGIMDLNRSGQSGGVIRSIGTELPAVGGELAALREQFPALKFDAIRNPKTGELDVFFGLKGLSNQAKRQIAQEGRAAGQTLWKDGRQYEYVRLSDKPDRIVVRTVDGKTTTITDDLVTDTPFIREDLGSPELDALFDDFATWVNDSLEKIAAGSGSMSEADLIQAIRAGHIRLEANARRAFNDVGALVYPEEAGMDLQRLLQVRLAQLDEFAGIAVATQDENLARKIAAERQRLFAGTAQGMLNDISTNGTEFTHLLFPHETISMEMAFRKWASVRGIEGIDMTAAQAHFAQRLRERLWASVDPDERAVFDAIRNQYEELAEAGKIPFESLAAQRGFSVIREGEQIVLREVTSGARFRFGSERAAQEAIAAKVPTTGDGFGDLLPVDNLGVGQAWHGAPTDWIGTINPRILSEDLARDLPGRKILATIAQNTRDALVRAEEMTNIPLFTRYFDGIHTGHNRMTSEFEPFSRRIAEIWDGFSREEKVQIANFWVEMQGSTRTVDEGLALGRLRGLSERQLDALRDARELYDLGHLEGGFAPGQYIKWYYTFQREAQGLGPAAFQTALQNEARRLPSEFKWWAKMHRHGRGSNLEMDPEIVMHKYFRNLFFEKHVAKPYNELARVIGTTSGGGVRVKDLPSEVQARVLRFGRDGTTPDSHIVPPELRTILMEYMASIRGEPMSSTQTLRRFSNDLFARLGLKTDDRILEEFLGIYQTVQYGSALGLRLISALRNFSQNTWLGYTRYGSRGMDSGMKKILTKEGAEEAFASGAIPELGAGVPQRDAIFEQLVGNPVFERTRDNAWTRAVETGTRKLLQVGHLGRETSQKLLVPFSTMDQLNRGWMYHWAKDYTSHHLARYETRRIGWETFLRDGLPLYAKPIKQQFGAIYNRQGREAALRWIGKMAADETNFIYGVGAQPLWMQSSPGRLVGMFGTWPLWAFELYARRARSEGIGKNLALFALRNAAVAGAFANMAMEMNVDMSAWFAPVSPLNYAGGPIVDMMVDTRDMMSGTLPQRAAAARRFGSDATSLFFPGQLFVQDITRAIGERDGERAFMSFFLGKPREDNLHYEYDFNSHPDAPTPQIMNPTILRDAEDQAGKLPKIEVRRFPSIQF